MCYMLISYILLVHSVNNDVSKDTVNTDVGTTYGAHCPFANETKKYIMNGTFNALGFGLSATVP